ncbi:MAG: TIGR01906 family membrane protein [Anaerolineae bacterium]|nr:TIGR01906 family membrane protein [Anaerolineae bacterium]
MLVVVVAVPVVLTMTLVRLLTFPWYPAWQYRRAGFPADPYGLPRQERLRLASATIRFLNIPGQTDILETLELPDGSPAYNDRELHHMDDVKAVYNGLSVAALGFLIAGAVSGWALWRAQGAPALWIALTRGATLTLALLVTLGAWMLLGFDRFFTAFHGVFFEPGTWVFYYTDTLIRLFPIEFWQTAGLLVAGGVTLLSLLLIALGRRMRLS